MASASAAVEQRNQEATLYVGGLDDRVDDELLWELFVQAGPVVSVHLPADKVTGRHQGFAFVEFRTEEDAEYAKKVMNMVRLYGKMIRVDNATRDKARVLDVGANLFIGNLAPEVDEKVLYDTFSAFGGIVNQPKVMRDPDTGASKGFGFVSFDCFEASDLAIEALNQQYLSGRPITVQYSFKRDAPGERHGGQVERLLAAAARNTQGVLRPHTLFGGTAGEAISSLPAVPMLGSAAATAPAPPMLPHTTILPASMMPPPIPSGMGLPGAASTGYHMPPPPPLPIGAGAGGSAGGSEGAGAGGHLMMPPPVPHAQQFGGQMPMSAYG